MKQRNKLFLLFSSAVLGSTLAIAIPQNTPTISAETVAAQPAAVNPSAPYANGVYPNLPMAYHKSGTQETSTMAKFMESKVTVTINGANATLSFPAKSKSTADMIKKFTVNGKPTVRKGDAFEVIVPSTTINSVLKGYVEISTVLEGNIPFSEKQTVDIKVNTTSIKKAETSTPAPKPDTKPDVKPKPTPKPQPDPKPTPAPKKDTGKKDATKKTTPKKVAPKKNAPKKAAPKATNQEVVSYNAHYLKKGTSARSTMAQYMSGKAEMYYQGGNQYVVIYANSGKSANMIKSMSLNGKSYFSRSGNQFYFNLGGKKLQNNGKLTLNGFVGVSTYIKGLGQFNENQPYTLRLDGRSVRSGKPMPTGSSRPATNQTQTSGNSGSATTAANGGAGKASVAVAKNSYYNYSAQFLKQGTSESSVMANYMLNAAHVEIKGNNAIITVFANSASSANMITHMTLGGQTASRSGNGYTVTLPKSELESVIAGHVDVDVPGVIHESQPFSLRLTPGFSGTPSAGGDSSSAEGAMGGNAFPMGSASNLNAANANSLAAAKKAADNAKKNGAKNGDNIKNPDATAQDKDKEKSDMNKIFLSIGGIISAVLGYIGTTLGWNIFRG
ncbi:hypothetical protein IE337_00065 [Weissella viridescens]|uniref:hypothetical protein n=1 Tax=Weissella viridescens TaxID=1629 RepID=UPI0017474101|nr:hypothetical protein [Weissella viridescens]QOD86057.1 hypothetical protein IE337_00065 [Weissella viridescens]